MMLSSAPNIPQMMKAIQASDYGDPEDVLSLQTNVPVPRLADLSPKQQKTTMLLKVLAVSLAPGDVRVLSGRTRELQGPPSMPYTPGGDVCGIVTELPPDSPFALGDRVAARFVDGPRGALGEYALVSTLVAAKVPDGMSSVDAAALVGATPAMVLAESLLQQKKSLPAQQRILVVGATGGVGSHLVQLLRNNPSNSSEVFVVGVSDTPSLLLEEPLQCHQAIDYTKQDVYSLPEFQKDPFDTIVDLHGGGFLRLLSQEQKSIVKPASQGGLYLTITPDSPWYDVHNIWQGLQIFLFPGLWRALKSRTWARRSLPRYTYKLAIPMDSNQVVTQTWEAVQEGRLRAVVANQGRPFGFTTEQVRQAFQLQASRHTKGKVVVEVASDDPLQAKQ